MLSSTFEALPVPDPKETLQLNLNHGTVKGIFRVFTITEEKFKIAYIPALKLSGYGDDQPEAWEMLKIAMDEYFKDLAKLSTDRITNELGLLGWKQDQIHKKRFSNIAFVDKEGILKNFNLPAETPILEQAISV